MRSAHNSMRILTPSPRCRLVLALIAIVLVGCLVGYLAYSRFSRADKNANKEGLPNTVASELFDFDEQKPSTSQDYERLLCDLDAMLNSWDLSADVHAGPDVFSHGSAELPGSVEVASQAVLEHYKRKRNCVLSGSGWIDLVGNSWGCLIYGGNWVDVCVVQAKTQSESECSNVQIVRLDKDEWETYQQEVSPYVQKAYR